MTKYQLVLHMKKKHFSNVNADGTIEPTHTEVRIHEKKHLINVDTDGTIEPADPEVRQE